MTTVINEWKSVNTVIQANSWITAYTFTVQSAGWYAVNTSVESSVSSSVSTYMVSINELNVDDPFGMTTCYPSMNVKPRLAIFGIYYFTKGNSYRIRVASTVMRTCEHTHMILLKFF